MHDCTVYKSMLNVQTDWLVIQLVKTRKCCWFLNQITLVKGRCASETTNLDWFISTNNLFLTDTAFYSDFKLTKRDDVKDLCKPRNTRKYGGTGYERHFKNGFYTYRFTSNLPRFKNTTDLCELRSSDPHINKTVRCEKVFETVSSYMNGKMEKKRIITGCKAVI